MRLLTLLPCILLLSGCQLQLQQLRLLDPQANDYNESLSSEYLAYANSETEQGHDAVAEHFASKGMDAYFGDAVVPEPVDESLPEATKKELTGARNALMLLQTDDMKSVAPQKLARAQLLFDCWIAQHKQNEKEQAPCASEFKSVADELLIVAESFVQGKETTHLLSFSKKSTMLDGESMQIIDEITDRVTELAKYTLVLEAFPEKKNVSHRQLSERRVQVVRDAFESYGVPSDRIETKQNVKAKAVYLSRDEELQNREKIKITVRTFDRKSGE